MSEKGKLDGLQIARAAAALGIAYFHSWHVTMPFPPDTAHPIAILMELGWISVDFFFAISGFVICLVVTSPNFRPASFLLRRAFRLYPLWIATSLVYLYLANRYLGRAPTQTFDFFLYSLTLLPTNGMPFYDIGWSLQHEMLFYLLAAIVTPWFGIYGVAAVLAAGVAADHMLELPWYLHQYFFYYGNFLAGIAAFLVHRSGLRPGFILPLVIGIVAFRWAPARSFFPIALFCWLVGFVNLNTSWSIGRLGALLGDASYSIYLLHPLVFYWIYIKLQPPLPPLWMQEPLRYGALMVVCVLAITSWKFFERRMIGLGERIDRYFLRRGTPPVLADQAMD
jgi:exopolysaccharide production protein ExoZ